MLTSQSSRFEKLRSIKQVYNIFFLGIYTRVKKYLSWIKNIAKDGHCTQNPTPKKYSKEKLTLRRQNGGVTDPSKHRLVL